jgi:hypothetical protein
LQCNQKAVLRSPTLFQNPKDSPVQHFGLSSCTMTEGGAPFNLAALP